MPNVQGQHVYNASNEVLLYSLKAAGGFQGIETLLEDMVKADTEWARLGQVPGLIDGWPDVKDKVGIATEEFKAGDLPQWACIV